MAKTTTTNTNINDTQALEKKKQETTNSTSSSTQTAGNIGKFLISVLISIIIIVGYFCLSSIVLYECKLAQSNILPTNLECYPYTDIYPKIEKVLTNIFVTNTDPQESVKMSFPYDKDNLKNTFLDMFRKYKEQPKSSFLLNYVISILEGLINYSNNALTIFFNLLNGMPEIAIILIGPIISLFYFGLVSIFGIFAFIYHYFSAMTWFFKENTNTNNNSKPVWKDVNMLEPVNYASSLFLVFLFFILFWVLLVIGIPALPVIIFYACLFSSLGYKCEINNSKATILTIISNCFKQYKVFIMILITLFVILSAFSNLGVVSGLFSILTVLLIYFNIIPMNIYSAVKMSNLSPLTSFEQAEKTCENTPIKSKTFLEGFQNFFELQKGGGNIGKELKKLHKKFRSE
jgi:hypothetical protein